MAKKATAAAPQVPADDYKLIPLNQLTCQTWKNVRRFGSSAESIESLANSIAAHGLLQNLNVLPTAEPEVFQVIAGGRRLRALMLLASRKQIPQNHPVPCRVVPESLATLSSLSENQVREALHPADQFEAFAAAKAQGLDVPEVAARFGVTVKFVEQRLKLAKLAPKLIAEYRAGSLTLEELEAFTITDDHEKQLLALEGFKAAPKWAGAEWIRDTLTEAEVPADDDLARYVGIDDYRAAGGTLSQDLFAEEGDGDGLFLTNPQLLRELAEAKLGAEVAPVKAEGWKWVEVRVSAPTYGDLMHFDRVEEDEREPTAKEAKKIEQLEKRIEALEQQRDAIEDDPDDEKDQPLRDEQERLEEELDAIRAGLVTYNPKQIPHAGAIVTIEDGKLEVIRGLIRKEDRAAAGIDDNTKAAKAKAAAERAVEKARQAAAAVVKPKPAPDLVAYECREAAQTLKRFDAAKYAHLVSQLEAVIEEMRALEEGEG